MFELDNKLNAITNAAAWQQLFCSQTHIPPSPTLGWGKRAKLNFFKNMVMLQNYQIKGIRKCSNMVANILPADPTPIPRSWG